MFVDTTDALLVGEEDNELPKHDAKISVEVFSRERYELYQSIINGDY